MGDGQGVEGPDAWVENEGAGRAYHFPCTAYRLHKDLTGLIALRFGHRLVNLRNFRTWFCVLQATSTASETDGKFRKDPVTEQVGVKCGMACRCVCDGLKLYGMVVYEDVRLTTRTIAMIAMLGYELYTQLISLHRASAILG